MRGLAPSADTSLGRDQPVGNHPLEHLGQVQAVLMRFELVHAGKYSMAYVTLCKRRSIRLHSFTNARHPGCAGA